MNSHLARLQQDLFHELKKVGLLECLFTYFRDSHSNARVGAKYVNQGLGNLATPTRVSFNHQDSLTSEHCSRLKKLFLQCQK